MNIYYWCPFLSNVATVKAVLNSAISIKKYSKNTISPHIINVVGEWNQLKDQIIKKNINLINFTKSETFYNSLPRYSYFKSRLSYIVIFYTTLLKLYSFLKNRDKQDIFIIHLISSLPLVLIFIFNFKCKFILRVSGYPKLNFFRKLLWRLCKKKISVILCPTEDTKKNLIEKEVFDAKSLHVLHDPIIEVKNISQLKKEQITQKLQNKNYILNIGRLTKQKNQKLLIEAFSKILKIDPTLYLVILGEGELEKELKEFAKKKQIYNRIFFLGHVQNVFGYLKNAKCFILTSKWEDPGFVLIEAAFLRQPIISSDCPNGPKEILSNGDGGYLFESNKISDLTDKFNQFFNDTEIKIKDKKLKTLKKSRSYSFFKHFINFHKILKLI